MFLAGAAGRAAPALTERRWDPTAAEWVIFAGHRQDRTYQPADDFCPLCPTRPGGPATEIPYPAFEVVTFDNRFPALQPDPPVPDVVATDLYPVLPALGRCEVVVYSDDHQATFADLGSTRTRTVVDVWIDRWRILGADPDIGYVLVFENKGAVIGTTLSHPHGQIYAYPDVPPRAGRELAVAAAHRARTGACVHCQVLDAELADGRRVVGTDGDWVAWVPYWARFPYEVHLAPRRHRPSLATLDEEERASLAGLLRTVTRTYDALWGFSLPYIMALHQRPTNDDEDWDPIAHLRVELTPPHRRADRVKHLAGSELAGGAFLSDVAPEVAAAELVAARRRLGS